MLILLVLLAIVGVLAAAVLSHRSSGGSPQPKASVHASAAPAHTAIRLAGARDFDPQGDDQTENPGEVRFAYDGNPRTRWRTVNYFGNPKLGGIKRGVGLVVDLGRATDVSRVKLLLSGTGTSLDVRVPKSGAATLTSPPMASDSLWRTVATRSDVGSQTTIDLPQAVRTRFVLVYLTSLPKEGSGYRGGIYEVEVDR